MQHRPVVSFRTKHPSAHLHDVTDARELEGALEHALERPTALLDAVQHYADLIHPYRDGRSSERVLDAVEECRQIGRAGLERKPWSPLRRFAGPQKAALLGSRSPLTGSC